MRYFEDNIIDSGNLHDLHDHLHKATGVVESNVLFMLTNEPDEISALLAILLGRC